MKIIRARHLGMCFGVRDAIALAHQEAARAPLTVLGDLVHNETVLQDLRRRGVGIEREPDAVRTQAVLITAHGASDRLLTDVRRRGHRLIEATCPLVHHAHQALRALVRDGFHPVVVGQRGHVEVRGLTEDYPGAEIVLSVEDVGRMVPRPRFGVVAQTTQPLERVQRMVEAMRARFPGSEVLFRDTVCQPTKLRQFAAEELASESDVVVVVGGATSNNTRELVAKCLSHCPRVHHVQTAEDLEPVWFLDTDVVGLTAGTSTPDRVIDAVEARLQSFVAMMPAREVELAALT